MVQEDAKAKLADELSKIRVAEPLEATLPVKLGEKEPVPQGMCHILGQHRGADLMLRVQPSAEPAELQNPQKKGTFYVSDLFRRVQQYMTYLFKLANLRVSALYVCTS